MAPRGWIVHLTRAAERDFGSVIEWTARRYGALQAGVYEKMLIGAVDDLTAGPYIPGSVARDDVRPGLRSVHISRARRRGSHVLIYHVPRPNVVEIIRILHDSMDVARHLPTNEP